MMLFKLLIVLVVLFQVVFSQEDKASQEGKDKDIVSEEEDDEEEENKPEEIIYWRMPHPDVQTSVVFPRYPDLQLPLGKPIEILLGFTNNGAAGKTFNITYLYGSLRYSQDPRVAIQNFSYTQPGDIVRPKKSVSFPYWFLPDSLLEPKDYFLTCQVEYTDEDNKNYSQLFYNTTIYMVDDTEYDLTGLFTYFIIFVGTAFAIFAFSKSGKTMIAEAITTTEVKKVTTVGAGSLDSWTSNAVMDQWKKKQSPKTKPAKK